MNTIKTTKFYVQAQKTEGADWITYGVEGWASEKDAKKSLTHSMRTWLNYHAFRITCETITTSFTAYQPITSLVEAEEPYCTECGSEEFLYLETYANGDYLECKECGKKSIYAERPKYE